MKKRYHIESGEPKPSGGDEREWFVLDRSRACTDCTQGGYACPGEVVFVGATRKAARLECAQLNEKISCQIQAAAASLEQEQPS